MLFGEGPDGPDLLLTERSHTMRSHPGQVSFPGGSVDPGETAQRGRAARGGGGDRARPEPGSRSSPSCPRCGCRRATSRSPRCWPGGASRAPVHAVSPDEVHAVYRVPIARAARPDAPHHRQRPGRVDQPRLPDRADNDVICWGFTAGVIARLFEYLGWIEDLPDAPEQELPAYMLVGRRLNQDVAAQHRVRAAAPRMNLLDWLLVRAGGGLRPLRLLAGFRHRRLRHRGAAARRALRRLAGADRARRRRTRRCWCRSVRCSS